MKTVRVRSRKYDGSLRDEYECYLYTETEEAFTLVSLPETRTYDHRKKAWLEAPDGLLEIYAKRRWYNVWHIAEPLSRTNLIYTNIATPVTLREGVLEWTDLDIDYPVRLDGAVERLDEEEFEENARRMGYPTELIERVQIACREVEAGLAHKTFPFDHERQLALYARIKRELGLP